MDRLSHNFRNSTKLFGTILGGLLMSMPVISQVAVAQQSTPKINPCPRIFYEEPHNNRVVVPQGCPPNAFTQRQANQGVLPLTNVPATPSQDQTRLGVGGEAPTGTGSSVLNPNPSILNEQRYDRSAAPDRLPMLRQGQTPVTAIAIGNGKVNVKLINDSGAIITYQVIGDTAPRSLQGKSDVTLQALNAPVTVTFQRDDGGLLTVTPQPSSEPGVLEVRFKETTDVVQDRNALRIEGNGSVFLN